MNDDKDYKGPGERKGKMNAENTFRSVYEKERQRFGVGLGSRGSIEERKDKD